jgi:imidazolonepropionase-like amidohydrolase
MSPSLLRRLSPTRLVALAAGALFVVLAATVELRAAPAVAFLGVNVVPMDSERVIENQDVVVRDGRIVSVAPAGSGAIPEDAQRVDGAGRWLMPGLAEMHGHVPGPDDPAYAENVLFLYVSNGVTTVRNMAGHPSHPALRDRIARGETLGPTLYVASPWLGAEIAGTPEAAREAVRAHKAAGFDLIKIGSLPAPAYRAMAETAHEIGMPFGGHIPADVGLVGALDARQSSIDHFDRYVEYLVPPERRPAGRDPGLFGAGWIGAVDEARTAEAVARTLAAGSWNVPTLSLVEHLASSEPIETMIARPEMRYMPQRVRESWVRSARQFRESEDFRPGSAQAMVDLRRRLLRELHEAGAPVALGSDAPQFFNVPGFSIHHEMRMMAAAGLSPYEVLAAGTREPARYFGTPDAFGTVAPGRRADLILLEANPLEDLANVQRRAGVMVRGRWLAEAEIQARLGAIASAMAAEPAAP